MVQRNLFGEIEEQTSPEPEVVPEMPELPPLPLLRSKRRKSFEIGICRACGQLLLDDPDNTRIKIDEELCPMCDERLKARYNRFLNFDLIKALRIHKNLNR